MFEMREDFEIAGGTRPHIHVTAFARNRHPARSCADHAGDAKAGAGSKHGAAAMRVTCSAAKFFQMPGFKRDDGERLRFKIVEHSNVAKTERIHHLVRFDHPCAIGEIDFVAFDRAGDCQHCRTRLDRCVVENSVLDCLIDGWIIRCLQDGKFLGFRIGVNQNGKSRIGTTDVTNQDRKFHDVVGICLCNHYSFPNVFSAASSRSKPLFCTRTSAVARFKAIGIS